MDFGSVSTQKRPFYIAKRTQQPLRNGEKPVGDCPMCAPPLFPRNPEERSSRRQQHGISHFFNIPHAFNKLASLNTLTAADVEIRSEMDGGSSWLGKVLRNGTPCAASRARRRHSSQSHSCMERTLSSPTKINWRTLPLGVRQILPSTTGTKARKEYLSSVLFQHLWGLNRPYFRPSGESVRFWGSQRTRVIYKSYRYD